MRNAVTLAVAATVFLAAAAPTAHAQRGVGSPAGVAQQPVKPVVVALSGRIIEVKTGPCESTTGRSLIGTHLTLETAKKEQLNVHLGPAEAVADTVAKLSVGQEITVKAFRTDKMKENHYVAQSLALGKATVELRDAGLRPVWSSGGIGPQGSTAGQAALGRGPGPGWGRGRQRWPAPPQRGPAAPEKQPGKIAVTAVAPSLDADIDPRFGRCRYFLLVDPGRETFEALENTNTVRGGAGMQAAEMIAAKGARLLLTGECGPSALKALAVAGVQVVPGCSGTVRAVIKQFQAGQLQPAGKAKVTPDPSAR